MLIELLWSWSELSRFEGLELACRDYYARLATLLPSAASAQIRLRCCLRDTMTVA